MAETDSNEARLGVPILVQREFRTNLLVFCDSTEEALRAAQRLHASVVEDKRTPLTVDDAAHGGDVYMFDVDFSPLSVDGFKLVVQVFATGGAGHPGLAAIARRSHVVIATGDLAGLAEHLSAEQRARVRTAGSDGILGEFRRSVLYVASTAHVEP